MNKLMELISRVEFDKAMEEMNESREYLESCEIDTEIPDNVIQVDFVNKKRLG